MRSLALLILSTCAVACGGGLDSPTSTDAGFATPAQQKRDAAVADAVVVPQLDASDRSAVAVPMSVNGSCELGAVTACGCPGGMPGTRACVSPDGQQSACGCVSAKGPDVLVPPVPPKEYSCGGVVCAAYAEEETSVSARGCCTKDQKCGSSSGFLFGDACVARGLDPGTPSTKCPDEVPNFVDIYGCCRPDGACGLSIDHVANFDVGCIERTQMSALLNAGSGQRDFLSLIFLLPNPKTDYKPLRCK